MFYALRNRKTSNEIESYYDEGKEYGQIIVEIGEPEDLPWIEHLATLEPRG